MANIPTITLAYASMSTVYLYRIDSIMPSATCKCLTILFLSVIILAISYSGIKTDLPSKIKHHVKQLSGHVVTALTSHRRVVHGGPAVPVRKAVLPSYASTIPELDARLEKVRSLFPLRMNPPSLDQRIHQLNASLSNVLPLQRAIPDHRAPRCRQILPDPRPLPAVSVIMPFHNEVWSMLLRGVTSLLTRTPAALLREVILVDDCSTMAEVTSSPTSPLSKFVQIFPKLRLIRTKTRVGLIQARLAGAKAATGDVLLFMDAHIEVGHDYLPPLLDVIRHNSSTVAVPHMDLIDPHSLAIDKWSGPLHGGFDWKMNYVWKIPVTSPPDDVTPIRTPTTIGCAFAIDREFFYRIGAFDENMYIWGGENLDISFRVWMCHGSMVVVPCSRVAHVFRAWLPYKFPRKYGGGAVIRRNYQRVVELLWGKHRALYYGAVHEKSLLTKKDHKSLRKRRALLDKLKCHNFTWYLDNVIPELWNPLKPGTTPVMTSPSTDRGLVTSPRTGRELVTSSRTDSGLMTSRGPMTSQVPRLGGQLKNVQSAMCLSENVRGAVPDVTSCGLHHPRQTFTRQGHTVRSRSFCLGLSAQGYIVFQHCNGSHHGDQHVVVNRTLPAGLRARLPPRDSEVEVERLTHRHRDVTYCLTQLSHRRRQVAGLQACDVTSGWQYWVWEYRFDFRTLPPAVFS